MTPAEMGDFPRMDAQHKLWRLKEAARYAEVRAQARVEEWNVEAPTPRNADHACEIIENRWAVARFLDDLRCRKEWHRAGRMR